MHTSTDIGRAVLGLAGLPTTWSPGSDQEEVDSDKAALNEVLLRVAGLPAPTKPPRHRVAPEPARVATPATEASETAWAEQVAKWREEDRKALELRKQFNAIKEQLSALGVHDAFLRSRSR